MCFSFGPYRVTHQTDRLKFILVLFYRCSELGNNFFVDAATPPTPSAPSPTPGVLGLALYGDINFS